MKENDLVNICCEYLLLKKYFFWRQNNTPISDIREGKRFFRKMPKYAMAGVPDIICILPDCKFLGIECKIKGNKQSESQLLFQKNCPGYYILIYELQHLINWLSAYKI